MKKIVVLVIALLLPVFSVHAESVMDRVKAPATVKAEYESITGRTKVFVDATVSVPDVEEIPTYEARQRLFTSEEIARAADVLMGEGQWRNVESYVQDMIFSEDPTPAYKQEAEGDDADMYLCFLCSPTEIRRWLNASYYDVHKPAESSNYVNLHYGYNEGENSSRKVGTPEDARMQADTMVAALWPELTFLGVDQQLSGLDERTSYGGPYDYGYRVYYTRVLSGSPVTQVEQVSGRDMGKIPLLALPRERLFVDVGAKGIFQVNYDYPIEIGGMLVPDVELLPFDKIMEAFAVIAPQTIALGEYATHNALHIDRIQLGYMGLQRKDDPTRYQMVPVWDFCGTHTIDAQVFGGERESQVTINATDGTVIDRTLVY